MPTLWEIESDFIRLLAELKRNGVKRDAEFCRPKLEQGLEICRKIKDDLGWNPGSPKQIGEFLLDEMKYPVLRRTEKGNPSFDKYAMAEYEEMLEHDGSDVAKKVIRYRGWQKTCSSNYKAYLELADENGIIHPNYKPHGTVTCRVSCELPNLQQIPRESANEWNGDLKKAFIPRHEDNLLIEFDFKQLEFRLAAAVAEEQDLLDIFNTDIDIFDAMAEQLNWPRHAVKTFTYATLYGAGVTKISIMFKVDLDEAVRMKNQYFSTYKGLKRAIEKAKNIAASQGYIEYWTGRRRHLTSDYRKAFNSFCQGGAFEIVKRAGLRLRRETQHLMVLTVHDSYLLEIPATACTPENLQHLQRTLEAVPEAEEMGVSFPVDFKEWGT